MSNRGKYIYYNIFCIKITRSYNNQFDILFDVWTNKVKSSFMYIYLHILMYMHGYYTNNKTYVVHIHFIKINRTIYVLYFKPYL